MTEAGRWTGEPGDIEVPALGNVNEYNHVAPNLAPSKIIPLRNLKVVQRHTVSAGEGEVRASAFDSSHIYIAPNRDPDPGIVKKVDPLDLSEVARWTGGVGDGKVLSLLRIDSYLYAGLDSSPGVVVKINAADMSEVDRWTGGGGDGRVNALTIVGTAWLFAGLSTGDVVKINTSTMAGLSRYSGAGQVLSLACDGLLYVYAGLNTVPSTVLQIILNTMALQFTWTGGLGDRAVNAMCYIGSVYAGLNSSPAVVVKLNSNTMVEEDRWTGGVGDNRVRSILLPGAVPPIYVGLETRTVVSLFVPGDMSELGRWTGGPADAAVLSLTQLRSAALRDHVWAGLNLSPGVMVPISMTSMREAKIWGNVNAARILSLISALPGSSLLGYAGLNTDPGVVIQFQDDYGALWEENRWTGGVGDGPVRSLALFARLTNHVFAGLETGQVVLLDDTMAEVARWEGTDPVIALVVVVSPGGDYVYAGLGTTPGKVVKIEIATMTEVTRWTGVGPETVTSLAYRGGYLYIGGTSPEGPPGPTGAGRSYGVLIP
jgi:hypothetical protein